MIENTPNLPGEFEIRNPEDRETVHDPLIDLSAYVRVFGKGKTRHDVFLTINASPLVNGHS